MPYFINTVYISVEQCTIYFDQNNAQVQLQQGIPVLQKDQWEVC